eukprot:scaffold16092_cov25-Prasinocladus_malaysianus.AAC.1
MPSGSQWIHMLGDSKQMEKIKFDLNSAMAETYMLGQLRAIMPTHGISQVEIIREFCQST